MPPTLQLTTVSVQPLAEVFLLSWWAWRPQQVCSVPCLQHCLTLSAHLNSGATYPCWKPCVFSRGQTSPLCQYLHFSILMIRLRKDSCLYHRAFWFHFFFSFVLWNTPAVITPCNCELWKSSHCWKCCYLETIFKSRIKISELCLSVFPLTFFIEFRVWQWEEHSWGTSSYSKDYKHGTVGVKGQLPSLCSATASLHRIKESQNGWLRLERTTVGHLIQPPCWSTQSTWHSVVSRLEYLPWGSLHNFSQQSVSSAESPAE